MSENKHTPGEWRHDIQYGPDGEANYAWVYDETGEMVATMRTHKAAKIVSTMNAAPDLLGALQAFVANYGNMEDGDGNEAPELYQARAAISKATGSEQ